MYRAIPGKQCFPGIALFFYGNFDISGICGDLTPATGGGLRHIHPAGIRLRKENLVSQQTSGHITGIGLHKDLAGIAAVKLHIACASGDRELFPNCNTGQRQVSGVSFRDKTLTGDIFQSGFAGGNLYRKLTLAGYIRDRDSARGNGQIQRGSGELFHNNASC